MPSLKVRRSRTLGEFLLGRGMGVFFFFPPCLGKNKRNGWFQNITQPPEAPSASSGSELTSAMCHSGPPGARPAPRPLLTTARGPPVCLSWGGGLQLPLARVLCLERVWPAAWVSRGLAAGHRSHAVCPQRSRCEPSITRFLSPREAKTRRWVSGKKWPQEAAPTPGRGSRGGDVAPRTGSPQALGRRPRPPSRGASRGGGGSWFCANRK